MPNLGVAQVHTFNIPTHSMGPTLLEGEHFLVVRYADDPGGPARGDVVALRGKDNTTVFIKRAVGLPGDRVQMKTGQLYINDVAVAREQLPDFVGGDYCSEDSAGNVKRWHETLPGGASYETLDCVDDGSLDNTEVFTVPAGHFFVLGDNRDNSVDSRMLREFGYVPYGSVIGRVSTVTFSRKLSRIGTTVR